MSSAWHPTVSHAVFCTRAQAQGAPKRWATEATLKKCHSTDQLETLAADKRDTFKTDEAAEDCRALRDATTTATIIIIIFFYTLGSKDPEG